MNFLLIESTIMGIMSHPIVDGLQKKSKLTIGESVVLVPPGILNDLPQVWAASKCIVD